VASRIGNNDLDLLKALQLTIYKSGREKRETPSSPPPRHLHKRQFACKSIKSPQIPPVTAISPSDAIGELFPLSFRLLIVRSRAAAFLPDALLDAEAPLALAVAHPELVQAAQILTGEVAQILRGKPLVFFFAHGGDHQPIGFFVCVAPLLGLK
jgi:hypothetical protein